MEFDCVGFTCGRSCTEGEEEDLGELGEVREVGVVLEGWGGDFVAGFVHVEEGCRCVCRVRFGRTFCCWVEECVEEVAELFVGL